MKRILYSTATAFLVMMAGLTLLHSDSSTKAQNPSVAKNVGSGVSKPKQASDKKSEDQKLLVYYFHGNARCMTCKKFESLTKDILETRFSDHLKKGRVEYRVVNVDDSGNKRFINDYQLYSKAVVLSDISGGKQVRWKNLDKIWEVIGDEKEYRKYIEGEVQAYLVKS